MTHEEIIGVLRIFEFMLISVVGSILVVGIGYGMILVGIKIEKWLKK